VIASVIIPAYNAAGTIRETLEACLAQDFPRDEFEVIVVDDGSTDATQEIVAEFPGVVYIHQDNAGAAVARNTGAAAAQGDILAFCDADSVHPPHWLQELKSSLQTDENIGIVGGIFAPSLDLPLFAAVINEEIRYRHVNLSGSPSHLSGFSMAMRRSVFDEVGGYTPQFRRAQDAEFSYKVVERGYRLEVLRSVEVIHNHYGRLRRWLRDQYYAAYWRLQAFRRHPEKKKGDSYTGPKDWLPPGLALGMLGLLPFVWLWPVPWIELGLLVGTLSLHIPVTVFAVKDTRDWRHVILMPLQVIRSFAWVFGAVAGVVQPPRQTSDAPADDEMDRPESASNTL